MNEFPHSSVLLKRVAARMRRRRLGKRFYLSFLACCCLYGLLLLTSRLLGLIPDVFGALSLLTIPLSSVFLTLLLGRRTSHLEAARSIDGCSGTKDLFLTTALLEKSAGEYKPLVARDAEQAAESVDPAEVVPLRFGTRFGHIVIALLLLWGGLHLGQFDPFGRVDAKELVEKQHQELKKTRKATKIRTAELKRNKDESRESKEVRKSLTKLKTTFQKMKPRQKKENLSALALHQKVLGAKWRKFSEGKLKELLSGKSLAQKFGSANNEKLRKWTRELQKGGTKGLRKELSELKKKLQQLQNTDDPVEKAEIAQRLKKRLKDLEEFSRLNVGSKELTAALKRALQQLELSKNKGDATEALEALVKSLELSSLELEQLAQAAKELNKLEDALRVLQMAKLLNEMGMLDGKKCEKCESMGDYESLYAKLMAGLDEGNGPGMGNKGIGEGGTAPEDDSVQTGYKAELSKSQLMAGKMLLSLKTKGLSDKGEAKLNYQKLIRTVKQGISEAIEQEQIPPGYHEGIKNYFDNIEKTGRDPDATEK